MYFQAVLAIPESSFTPMKTPPTIAVLAAESPYLSRQTGNRRLIVKQKPSIVMQSMDTAKQIIQA